MFLCQIVLVCNDFYFQDNQLKKIIIFFFTIEKTKIERDLPGLLMNLYQGMVWWSTGD